MEELSLMGVALRVTMEDFCQEAERMVYNHLVGFMTETDMK